MTNEQAKKIKNRILRGEKYWTDECRDKFETFRNYLKIKHWPETKEFRDRISVPYVHSILRTKLPAIYMRNPQFLISAKKKINPNILETTLINQPKMQAVMDYLPDEIGMKRQSKRTVLDALAFGRGVMEIGFEFEMEEKNLGLIDKAKALVGWKTDDTPKINIDRFFVKRVSYPDGGFVIDPNAVDGLNDAKWCAEKVTVLWEDFQLDKTFKHPDELKPNAKTKKNLTLETGSSNEQKEEEYLEYWKYFEKNRYGVVDKYCCIVIDKELVIKEGKNPYSHKEFPYETFEIYDIPDYLFSMGDIEPIKLQQEELDKSESIMFTHLKRFLQKYKGVKGKIDSKARTAFEAADNTLIELDDLADLAALENPGVNQTVPLSTQTIKDDITQISGISEYQRAAMPDQKRTLGEAQMIEQGARARNEEALDMVQEYMTRVGRKLMQVVQQHLTSDMMLNIQGDGTNPENWQPLDAEQIQGEFELKVESYSTSPPNKEKLRQDTMALYNLLVGDPTLPPEAKLELRRWLLEAFDKKNIEPFLQLAPPPMPPPPAGNVNTTNSNATL